MPVQNTPCGISNFHLLSIPGVGDFRLGDEDYKLEPENVGNSIKVKANLGVTEFQGRNRTWTITLTHMDGDTLNDLRDAIRDNFLQYLSTGAGGIDIDFDAKPVEGCYIKPGSLTISPTIFKEDGTEVTAEVTFKLIYDNPTLYV